MEVVVAISLMAFGLALTFGTLRAATKATARAEALAQSDERLRAVQGFLRTQLNGALPIAFEFDGDSGEATFLRAEPGRLEFVALMPGYLARGGPYVQTLELVRGQNGQQLQFQHRLLTSEGAAEAEREPVVLLDGIAEASFKLPPLDGQSRPGRWQEQWEVSAQLPALVRMDVRFIDPQRRWPAFVAALRLASPSADGTGGQPLDQPGGQ